MPLASFVTEERYETADDLFDRFRSYDLRLQDWAFRGHQDANWNLQPSIERLRSSYPNSIVYGAEQYVRTAFTRRAHHYLQRLPDEGEQLEWLALMRHHGAPTRLLDWTRSPYVATFFALAEAREDQVSAIWAIHTRAIKSEAIQILVESGVIEDPKGNDFSFSDPKVFDSVFLQKSHPAIIAPVQPLKMNERVTSQQGLFLCPNSLDFGFEFALKQVLKSESDKWRNNPAQTEPVVLPQRLFKLYIDPKVRSQVLRELHRMNINYATLFPGLDGFARSLETNVTLSVPHTLWPDEFDSRI
jgi:hypothetical protein